MELLASNRELARRFQQLEARVEKLVAHDQIPAPVGHRQLGLHILVAAQLVETGDDEIVLHEPITRACRLQFVVGQDFEREVETTVKLVLPLFRKAARAHDKAPLKVAARNQLLRARGHHAARKLADRLERQLQLAGMDQLDDSEIEEGSDPGEEQ